MPYNHPSPPPAPIFIRQAFAWEPVNNKFGIISGEPPSVNVTFFQVNKGQAPTELKKLEKRPCNNLFWSPQGQFVVLAGLRSMNGALEFIDTKDFQVSGEGLSE